MENDIATDFTLLSNKVYDKCFISLISRIVCSVSKLSYMLLSSLIEFLILVFH